MVDPSGAAASPPPSRPRTSGKAGTPSELREWAATISPGAPEPPPRDDASGPPPAPAPASSSPPTTAAPRRSFGIPDGTPTARAKLVNAERGTGGALLNGFSCESGSNAGVWDKIVTPARRS